MRKFELTFKKKGYVVEYYDLNEGIPNAQYEPAAVIIIRKGLSMFVNDIDSFFEEENSREWDTKAFMRGQVKNKHARYNLCYSDFSQEPDFESGKGRVVNFEDSKHMLSIRKGLGKYLGSKASDLKAEGNKYYNLNQCGIGWHGDSERKIVIAFRLGETMPLRYAWFQRNMPISEPIDLGIGHGDMYIMSGKAVGTDWRKSSIPTLRHAAGCDKYTSLKVFKKRAEKRKGKKEGKGEGKLMTVKEARELAKNNDIKGYSKLKKGELIKLLKANGAL